MLKDYRINESHQATDADDDGHHVEQSRLLPDHRLRGSRPELHDQVRQRQADGIPTITAETKVSETKVSGTEKDLFLHPCTSKSMPDTFIPLATSSRHGRSPPGSDRVGSVGPRPVRRQVGACDKRGDVCCYGFCFLGRPLGGKQDSKPSRSAVSLVHASPPNGRPRPTA